MKIRDLIPTISLKTALSKKQSILAACFAFSYYLGVVFLSESNLGQVVQFNMATSLEYKAKRFFKKTPELNERIKILSVGDQSVAILNRTDLFLHEWAGILKEIAKYKPSKIIVDKIFGVSNATKGQETLALKKLAEIKTPIVTGAFLSPKEIPGREGIDISTSIVAMEKKLGIGLDVINPVAFDLAPTMPAAVSRLGREDTGIVYARHKSLGDAFFVNGFYNYNGKLKFTPFVNFSDEVVFPHAAMLAANSIAVDGESIIVDGRELPLNTNGNTLINLVAKDRFFRRIRSLIDVKRFAETINEGDIVVILPNMFTGSTDFHDSPIGYVPGGYFIVSIINSILSGEWISELGYDWLQLLFWSFLGLATAVFLSTSRYWITLFALALICVGTGIYSFSYHSVENSWWWSLVCFLGISLAIFVYKSLFFEKFKEINDEIKDILNSIDQAIFTFNHDLSVNSEISKKAGEFFDSKLFLSHSTLDKVFGDDPKKLNEFADWRELMFKAKTLKKWSKYEILAPVKQIELERAGGGKRVVAFDYKPILRKDVLKKIMVLGKDITAQIEMERQMKETQLKHEAQMQRMLAFINHESEMVFAFIKEAKDNITYFNSLEDPKRLREDIDEAYREMHTLKGNAGSFGFSLLASVANEAEEHMAEVRRNKNDGTSTGSLVVDQPWIHAVEDIKQELSAIEAVGESIFHTNNTDLVIDRNEYQQLLTRYEAVSGFDPQIMGELKNLSAISFQKCLKKYEEMLVTYCEKSGKEQIELKVLTPEKKIAKKVFQLLDKALVHLIRNALDHGIESTEERLNRGKGRGCIEIGLYEEDGTLKVTVEDDGQGLDPEVIYEAAVSKGIVLADSQLSEMEKIHLIFKPGFSSRDEADDMSGRGVGMDVVEKIVKKAGGSIDIESRIGHGTKFTVVMQDL